MEDVKGTCVIQEKVTYVIQGKVTYVIQGKGIPLQNLSSLWWCSDFTKIAPVAEAETHSYRVVERLRTQPVKEKVRVVRYFVLIVQKVARVASPNSRAIQYLTEDQEHERHRHLGREEPCSHQHHGARRSRVQSNAQHLCIGCQSTAPPMGDRVQQLEDEGSFARTYRISLVSFNKLLSYVLHDLTLDYARSVNSTRV
jgi:hypothetical protein